MADELVCEMVHTSTDGERVEQRDCAGRGIGSVDKHIVCAECMEAEVVERGKENARLVEMVARLTRERDSAQQRLEQCLVECDSHRAVSDGDRDQARAEVERLKAAIDDAHAHATASVEAVRRWMLDPHQESPIHLMASRARHIVERLDTHTPKET